MHLLMSHLIQLQVIRLKLNGVSPYQLDMHIIYTYLVLHFGALQMIHISIAIEQVAL